MSQLYLNRQLTKVINEYFEFSKANQIHISFIVTDEGKSLPQQLIKTLGESLKDHADCFQVEVQHRNITVSSPSFVHSEKLVDFITVPFNVLIRRLPLNCRQYIAELIL